MLAVKSPLLSFNIDSNALQHNWTFVYFALLTSVNVQAQHWSSQES